MLVGGGVEGVRVVVVGGGGGGVGGGGGERMELVLFETKKVICRRKYILYIYCTVYSSFTSYRNCFLFRNIKV